MCKKDLPIETFKKNARRKDGLQSQCISCQKEYRKSHYNKNRKKYIDKAAKWKVKFRLWWTEYKKQFSCKCGESHQACIEFHHPDNNKEAGIADLIGYNCKSRILKEIAKCIPMCSNCHKKLHWDQRRSKE